jgi:hypothetical protein
MMGSMTGMQSGMMSQMFNKTPKDLGVEADKDAKDGDKTLGEYVREKDPHFEERMAITSRIMHEEIGKMMGQMEPQLRESLATLYARRFSMTELNDIAAFFRTPSGRNYAMQMIPMMSDPEYLQSMAGLAPKLMQGMPAIFVIERVVKQANIVGVAEMPLKTVIGVGLIQCLSMVPGVSRSGATILGGLSLGVERRTAAEFSFFLAIPTMLGATTLELARHHDTLIAGAGDVGFAIVAVGFVVSFVVAIVVVKGFVHYISRHGFAPFAWYRILAGLVALAWLGMR